MEKIVNYIKSGKGNGLLFLVATALITTIFWMLLFKQFYNDVKPQILLASEQILPITVKDSQITEPLDTYKKVDIMFGDKEETDKTFPIILDTRAEPENFDKLPIGLFIGKNNVKLKLPSEIKTLSWQDGIWNKNTLEEFLDYISGTFSFMLSIIIVAIFSIILVIKTAIAAFLEKYIIGPILKVDSLNFDTFMRLSAVLISITELILLGLSFLTGIRVGILPQIFVILLIAYAFLAQQKKAEN